jgi:hypothetical protein
MCGGKEKKGCQKPANLKGRPGECSPEQIRMCHGDGEGHPCVAAAECEHPEKLKGRKPGGCSPEQVRECHGEVAEQQRV